MVEKVFEIEALGHKYKCRWSEPYGYYWVESDTGYMFKVDKETFDNEYLDNKSS